MIQADAIILSVTDLGADYFLIEARCAEVASLVKPGHFINIRVTDTDGVTLRRPFGIFDVDKDVIKIFAKVIGRGTKWLSNRRAGDTLDILGPLGKGIFEPAGAKRVIMVAGGTGLAPLYFALNYFKKSDFKKIIFYGAKDSKRIFLKDELLSLADECFFVTDDGSLGKQGLVGDELKRFYATDGCHSGDLIMTCGPKFMMRDVIYFAESKNIPCQASLESYMGCGAGVCLSCVIPAEHYTNDGQSYFKLCTDGPVVDSKIINKKFFDSEE